MVLFQRRVYENVEPAFVYDIPKSISTIISFWQSYDFLSFRFSKEDSRCPTFLAVEGSRDLFHNVPLRTILHRWVGLEIWTVPVVTYGDATCSSVPVREYTALASRLLCSVNKLCDALRDTNRKVEGESAPASCQASLSKQHDSSPTTRTRRTSLRHTKQ